jgi:hypothetical protein
VQRSIPLAVVVLALLTPGAFASPRPVGGAMPRCTRHISVFGALTGPGALQEDELRGSEEAPWHGLDAAADAWDAAPLPAELSDIAPLQAALAIAPAPAPSIVAAAPRPTLLVKAAAAVGALRERIAAVARVWKDVRAIVGTQRGCVIGDRAAPTVPVAKPKTLTLF